MNKQKIFLIDADLLTCKGIQALIREKCSNLKVVGHATDCVNAIRQMDDSIDLVIVEIFRGDGKPIESLEELRKKFLNLKILVFSGLSERTHAPLILDAGVSGYVEKSVSEDKFLKSVQEVLNGGYAFSEEISKELIAVFVDGGKFGEEPFSLIGKLSKREKEVFDYIGKGWNSKKIAEKLGIKEGTVDAHRSHIVEKLKITINHLMVVAAKMYKKV